MAKRDCITSLEMWKSRDFRKMELSKKNLGELIRFLVDYSGALGANFKELDRSKLVTMLFQNESWLRTPPGDSLRDARFKRDPEYASGWKRLQLHAQIVESLMTKKRPKNPGDISIKRGGALPRSGLERSNTAFLVSGPPAAGKSRLSDPLAEGSNSLIVDPDDIKKMLPEYRGGLNASNLHEESSALAKGVNGVFDCAVTMGANVVIPLLGCDYDKLLIQRKQLIDSGYTKIFLVTIHCPIEIAVLRSLKRLSGNGPDTGRYIPIKDMLTGIWDSPLNTYRKAKRSSGWHGTALFHCSLAGGNPLLIEENNFDIYIDIINNKTHANPE